MSALQKKYFGKRHKKVKVIRMARRRRSYAARRFGGFARRTYHRARGLGGGRWGGMLPPLIGGAADSFLSGMNIFGLRLPSGVGATAVGVFMHSQTTRDIGLYQIGASLPNMLGAGGAGGLGHVGQV